MTFKYSTLSVGQDIPIKGFLVDTNSAMLYASAVEDSTAIIDKTNQPTVVPPMAIAALGLKAILESLGIPEGALHSSQELNFHGPFEIGSEFNCQATVERNSVRKQSRFVSIKLSVRDYKNREVMSGTTTLIIPINGVS